MPIKPIDAPETEGAFEVVHRTLSSRASASAFSLPRLSKADPHRLTIAMPHRVEFLALGDVRRGTIPRKQKADCWRFLVLEEREAIAAATAIRAETELFEFGGLDEGPFVRGTEEAILRAEAFLEGREEQFEAVLLLVPAVYVVALWLQALSGKAASDHSPDADLLIAIPPSNPALDPAEPMTPASFLEALRRAR
jgi:hypothetical protein